MNMKRAGRMMVGILLTAASIIMIPKEISRGDILLIISGGCFGIAGLAFLVENIKRNNIENKEDVQ